MAALYLESSAVLCWLLGEPQADEVRHAVGKADMVVSATLTWPCTGADAVALRITTVALDGTRREDIIISALRGELVRSATVASTNPTFQGRFGLVAVRDGKATAMSLIGGGHIALGNSRLDGRGNVLGNVAGVEPAENAVLIQIGALDAAKGSFASSTPVMKLRVNPGLFNGKCVRNSPDAAQHRLSTATEGPFNLADPKALADFSPDGTYTVYDVGIGDEAEILGVCASPPAWPHH